MKHQVVVYYAFCPNFFESKKIYRKHQRELEDKILSYDFINRFNIQFEYYLHNIICNFFKLSKFVNCHSFRQG